MGASSSGKASIKTPVTGARVGTTAVKIVAGGTQNTATQNISSLKPDSEVVKSAISEKVAPAAASAPADEYDEDEEMLMYDDVNDGDNEYGYDDDEYY